jgi:hypothetical protein
VLFRAEELGLGVGQPVQFLDIHVAISIQAMACAALDPLVAATLGPSTTA